MTNNPTQRRIYARQPVRTKRRIFVASRRLKAGLICVCFLGIWKQSVAQTSASPIKNIVLVHGAWVDGSGWKPVYDILTKDGYTVTLVQEPLTSFAEDVRDDQAGELAAAFSSRSLHVGPMHSCRSQLRWLGHY